MSRKSRAKPHSPFRYFHSAPELIREVVMLYIRFPLSLRNVEDLLFERGYASVRGTWRAALKSIADRAKSMPPSHTFHS